MSHKPQRSKLDDRVEIAIDGANMHIAALAFPSMGQVDDIQRLASDQITKIAESPRFNVINYCGLFSHIGFDFRVLTRDVDVDDPNFRTSSDTIRAEHLFVALVGMLEKNEHVEQHFIRRFVKSVLYRGAYNITLPETEGIFQRYLLDKDFVLSLYVDELRVSIIEFDYLPVDPQLLADERFMRKINSALLMAGNHFSSEFTPLVEKYGNTLIAKTVMFKYFVARKFFSVSPSQGYSSQRHLLDEKYINEPISDVLSPNYINRLPENTLKIISETHTSTFIRLVNQFKWQLVTNELVPLLYIIKLTKGDKTLITLLKAIRTFNEKVFVNLLVAFRIDFRTLDFIPENKFSTFSYSITKSLDLKTYAFYHSHVLVNFLTGSKDVEPQPAIAHQSSGE